MRIALTLLALVATNATVRADRAEPIRLPIERALSVPVVVVGKVTSIEKEMVDAPLYAGATNKVAHKIAVVKIESNLAGAAGITHLKVGFVPAGAAGVRPGRGPDNPVLAEGQEWLFFLNKNPSGEFYAIPYMTPPLESKAADYKAQVENVKKLVAVLADPRKALKAEKAEERSEAAIALVLKYRSYPQDGREVEVARLAADESKLILKGLAERPWKFDPMGGRFNAMTAFYQLGLGESDGWKPPVIKAGQDATEITKQAFLTWLEGAGKDYKIKTFVPKKK